MSTPHSFRWRPALVILLISIAAWLILRAIENWAFEQLRSYAIIGVFLAAPITLLIWWVGFSNLSLRLRLLGIFLAGALLSCFQFPGMTGDFLPIIQFRFREKPQKFIGKDTARKIPGTDFPQIFGPSRDCRLPGPAINPRWDKNPPQIVWRQPIGPAWSGFSIVGDRAVTMEQEGENECVTCYEITTGRQLWKASHPARYDTQIAGLGPRATPTIAGERVFSFGATGVLTCHALADGKLLWKRDAARDLHAPILEWGFASSPLIVGENVVVSVGGEKSLLACRTNDGSTAWMAGTQAASYSSPFLLRVGEREIIVIFNAASATAHNPTDGSLLWQVPWGKGLPHVARPIPVMPNRIFFSSGYGVGSALYEIKEKADGRSVPEQLWKTPRFQAKFSNPIEHKGFVYGVSDGILACLELANGKVRWKSGRYGHGQGLLIADHYLQMAEYPGELVLISLSPEGAKEQARFRVFDDKTWNPLALSGDLLLIRNDREAACIRLPTQK